MNILHFRVRRAKAIKVNLIPPFLGMTAEQWRNKNLCLDQREMSVSWFQDKIKNKLLIYLTHGSVFQSPLTRKGQYGLPILNFYMG